MDCFDDLVTLLQNEAAPVEARRDAARELALTKDPRCVELLLALLASPQPPALRFELVFDLGHLHDPRAFDAFSSIIRDRHEPTDLRGLAAELISHLDGIDAVPVLIEALRAPDPMIRFDAAWSLSTVGDDRARPALEEHRNDPERPYGDAGTIGDIATQALRHIARRSP